MTNHLESNENNGITVDISRIWKWSSNWRECFQLKLLVKFRATFAAKRELAKPNKSLHNLIGRQVIAILIAASTSQHIHSHVCYTLLGIVLLSSHVENCSATSSWSSGQTHRDRRSTWTASPQNESWNAARIGREPQNFCGKGCIPICHRGAESSMFQPAREWNGSPRSWTGSGSEMDSPA